MIDLKLKLHKKMSIINLNAYKIRQVMKINKTQDISNREMVETREKRKEHT